MPYHQEEEREETETMRSLRMTLPPLSICDLNAHFVFVFTLWKYFSVNLVPISAI